MNNRHYSSIGIIISRRNFSEADRILTLYTETFGKLKFIAKGIRKLGSRKRGHLEIFSMIKFSASKTTNLPLLTEVETIDDFGSVREDLRKVAVGYYFMEVIEKITQEGEKNTFLFGHLVSYLNLLQSSGDLKKLRESFVRDTLTLTGFWPQGQTSSNIDLILENVTERKFVSSIVGKKLLG